MRRRELLELKIQARTAARGPQGVRACLQWERRGSLEVLSQLDVEGAEMMLQVGDVVLDDETERERLAFIQPGVRQRCGVDMPDGVSEMKVQRAPELLHVRPRQGDRSAGRAPSLPARSRGDRALAVTAGARCAADCSSPSRKDGRRLVACSICREWFARRLVM